MVCPPFMPFLLKKYSGFWAGGDRDGYSTRTGTLSVNVEATGLPWTVAGKKRQCW